MPAQYDNLFANRAGWITYINHELVIDTRFSESYRLSPRRIHIPNTEYDAQSLIRNIFDYHKVSWLGENRDIRSIQLLLRSPITIYISALLRSAPVLREKIDFESNQTYSVYSEIFNTVMNFYDVKKKIYSFKTNINNLQNVISKLLEAGGSNSTSLLAHDITYFQDYFKVAATIYKNLVINLSRKRCMYTLGLTYTLASGEIKSFNLVMFSVLKDNMKVVITQVLYIAFRLTKVLKDKTAYGDDNPSQASLTHVVIKISAGQGFGVLSHSVHSLISISEFWSLTRNIEDEGAVASFNKLKMNLSKKNLNLTSPTTTKNCVIAAIMLSFKNKAFENMANKSNFLKLVSNIKAKLDLRNKDESSPAYLFDLVNEFTKKRLYIGYYLKILNMFGDVVYKSEGKSKSIKYIPQNNKDLRILIFSGHAFGLVSEKIKQKKKKEKLYTTMLSVEDRYLMSLEDSWRDYMIKEKRQIDFNTYCKQANITKKLNYIYGVFDIETYKGDDGYTVPYAIGWKIPKSISDTNPDVIIDFNPRECVSDFFKYIYDNVKESTVLYAHNSTFDLSNFLDYLFNESELFFIDNILLRNGKILALKVVFNLRKKTKTSFTYLKKIVITFKDSYALLPESQESIARQMNVETQKGHMNHKIITADNVVTEWNRQNIHKYLYKDVQGLWEILHTYERIFIEENNFSPLVNALSTAGVSRKLFLTKFYDYKKYPLYELGSDKVTYVSQAFLGGISENTYKGEYPYDFYNYKEYLKSELTKLNKAHLTNDLISFLQSPSKTLPEWITPDVKKLLINILDLDVKSLYPYCMVNFKLPYGKGKFVNNLTIKNFQRFYGWMTISVKGGRSNDFNILYIRSESHGLIAPVFRYWHEVVIFSEEFKFIYKHRERFNYKFKIKGFGLSFNKGPVLRNQCLYLFNKKESYQKGTAMYLKYKLEVNSTFGFPALREVSSTVGITTSENVLKKYFWTGALKKVRKHPTKKFYIYSVEKEIDASFRNKPLSAATTSYGRIVMNNARIIVEDCGGKTLQVETDSMKSTITDISLLKSRGLKTESVLGGFVEDLVEKPGDEIIIMSSITAAPKMWAIRYYYNGELKEKVKCKGFPKGGWDKRRYDEEGNVIFSDYNKSEGKYKLSYDNLKSILNGKKITYEHLRFIGGEKMWFNERPGLRQKLAKVTISGVINKGVFNKKTLMIEPHKVYIHFLTYAYINGDKTFDILHVNTTTTTEDLVVNNDLHVNGDIVQHGDETVDGNLTVNNDLTVNNGITAVTSHITGDETVDGNLTVAGDLVQDGDETIEGNLNVNDTLTSQTSHVLGNETIDGNLNLTGYYEQGGDAIFNSSVSVYDTLVSTTSHVLEDQIVDGSLTVNEYTTLKGVTVNKDLDTNGNITAVGNVRIEGSLLEESDSRLQDVLIRGTLNVDERTTLDGDLDANGNSTLEILTVNEEATIYGNIYVFTDLQLLDTNNIKISYNLYNGILYVKGSNIDNTGYDDIYEISTTNATGLDPLIKIYGRAEFHNDLSATGNINLNNSHLYMHSLDSSTGTNLVIDSHGKVVEDTSSLRYKRNVRELNINPGKLLNIKPHIYNRINDERDRDEIGYIVEDVEDIPYIYNTDSEGQLKSFNYSGMFVYLLELIKANNLLLRQLSDICNVSDVYQELFSSDKPVLERGKSRFNPHEGVRKRSRPIKPKKKKQKTHDSNHVEDLASMGYDTMNKETLRQMKEMIDKLLLEKKKYIHFYGVR